MTLKFCPQCQKHKPATLAYFYPHAGKRDGLQTICRMCHNSSAREWYANPDNRQKKLEYNRRYRKECKQIREKWRG